jgi:hypothetical protein
VLDTSPFAWVVTFGLEVSNFKTSTYPYLLAAGKWERGRRRMVKEEGGLKLEDGFVIHAYLVEPPPPRVALFMRGLWWPRGPR